MITRLVAKAQSSKLVALIALTKKPLPMSPQLPDPLNALAQEGWTLLGSARLSQGDALGLWQQRFTALAERDQERVVNWLQKSVAAGNREKYPAWLRRFVALAALMIAGALLLLDPKAQNAVFFWVFLPPLLLLLGAVVAHRTRLKLRQRNLALLLAGKG